MNPVRSKHAVLAVSAFTLIELLVVIAIIAILAVVVVLTLNPAQLLAQSRDANRVSDMATLNTALGLYQTDSGGTGFMGTSSIVYTSLTDTSSTCGSLNLPALSSGSYNCTVSTSTRNANSTGWIPIDFTKISAGTPLGSLPIDPTNQSSTGLYYTYNTSNAQFEITALPESQKQKASLGAKPSIPNYPDVIANGSSLTINPLFNASGLVGYWPMDEGSGSSTQDLSGSNNLGSWAGTAIGTKNTYYIAGRVGSYAGAFDGTSTYASVPIANYNFQPSSVFTISTWINTTDTSGAQIIGTYNNYNVTSGYALGTDTVSGVVVFIFNTIKSSNFRIQSHGSTRVNDGLWHQIAVTYNGSGNATGFNFYVDGNHDTNTVVFNVNPGTMNGSPLYFGRWTFGYWSGALDDVRIYNRALSAAEVVALYNAGR